MKRMARRQAARGTVAGFFGDSNVALEHALCFSVIAADRDLDAMAQTEQQRDAYMAALQQTLFHLNTFDTADLLTHGWRARKEGRHSSGLQADRVAVMSD